MPAIGWLLRCGRGAVGGAFGVGPFRCWGGFAAEVRPLGWCDGPCEGRRAEVAVATASR